MSARSLTFVVLSVLVVLSPATGTAFPDVAFEKLTEEELEDFIEASPAVFEAFEMGEFVPDIDLAEGTYDLTAFMVAFVEGVGEAEGVADALEEAGADWDTYRGTFYKVMVAAMSATAGDMEQMFRTMASESDDKAAKNGVGVGFLDAIDRVPAGNVELVREHMDELNDFLD